VLLLVHGLCMSDDGWRRGGHDHGQALAPALGAVPVYALYNSGLHISHNGLALSQALAESDGAFDPVLCALVAASERDGQLVAVLRHHAAFLAWSEQLRDRLVAAGFDMEPLTPPAQLAASVRTEFERNAATVKQFNIQLQ
jgi:hypothetical protein